MKRLVAPLAGVALLGSIGFLQGCVQVMSAAMMDGLNRNDWTGATYTKSAAKFGPLPPDRGRVFFYRTKASTTTESEVGKVLTKNVFYCMFDERLHKIVWEAFLPVEWDLGEYTFSCGNVVASTDYLGRETLNKIGSQRVLVSIKNGVDAFVRIDLIDNKPTPTLVPPEVAKSEMADLEMQLLARPFVASRVQ